MFVLLFFFNDTATTEIYTLSLHDALPISCHDMLPELRARPRLSVTIARKRRMQSQNVFGVEPQKHFDSACAAFWRSLQRDRKSTRLNSSHVRISYAVFCLKKTNIPSQTS